MSLNCINFFRGYKFYIISVTALQKCQNELENAEKRYEELRQRIDPDASEKLEETKEMERSSKAKLELLTKNKCDIESAIKVLDDQKVRHA